MEYMSNYTLFLDRFRKQLSAIRLEGENITELEFAKRNLVKIEVKIHELKEKAKLSPKLQYLDWFRKKIKKEGNGWSKEDIEFVEDYCTSDRNDNEGINQRIKMHSVNPKRIKSFEEEKSVFLDIISKYPDSETKNEMPKNKLKSREKEFLLYKIINNITDFHQLSQVKQCELIAEIVGGSPSTIKGRFPFKRNPTEIALDNKDKQHKNKTDRIWLEITGL